MIGSDGTYLYDKGVRAHVLRRLDVYVNARIRRDDGGPNDPKAPAPPTGLNYAELVLERHRALLDTSAAKGVVPRALPLSPCFREVLVARPAASELARHGRLVCRLSRSGARWAQSVLWTGPTPVRGCRDLESGLATPRCRCAQVDPPAPPTSAAPTAGVSLRTAPSGPRCTRFAPAMRSPPRRQATDLFWDLA
jgi:hypothetical protein